jgi:Zn-dependent peptidase ImmA (M78 family)
MLAILKEADSGGPVAVPDLLPIDLWKLAGPMGLRIEEVDDLGETRVENPWRERDTKVSGLFDRESRTITLVSREPHDQKRFTLAHEFGHVLYHSGPLQLKQRAARASFGSTRARPAVSEKPIEEREADIFAVELLMPVQFVRSATIQRFGEFSDMNVPSDELACYLSRATKRTIDPERFAQMPQYDRALLFAGLNIFREKPFVPLMKLFGVSSDAMAIRLLELGLVS